MQQDRRMNFYFFSFGQDHIYIVSRWNFSLVRWKSQYMMLVLAPMQFSSIRIGIYTIFCPRNDLRSKNKPRKGRLWRVAPPTLGFVRGDYGRNNIMFNMAKPIMGPGLEPWNSACELPRLWWLSTTGWLAAARESRYWTLPLHYWKSWSDTISAPQHTLYDTIPRTKIRFWKYPLPLSAFFFLCLISKVPPPLSCWHIKWTAP